MRFEFGLTGNALIDGSIDLENCTRCTAAACEEHLENLHMTIDVDGDGEIDPFYDGFLILRWLFGFRGDQLISGVVDTDCTRCTASEIESYLQGLS
jgi:hypothetical protein